MTCPGTYVPPGYVFPRTRNGCAAGELATLEIVNGAAITLAVTGVIHTDSGTRVQARVTGASRYGYKSGEVIELWDTAFLTRRP